MSYESEAKQAIIDEFYFDHLDCSDECSKKDAELRSIQVVVGQLKEITNRLVIGENQDTHKLESPEWNVVKAENRLRNEQRKALDNE